jgi:sugar phosphate isomerase/epimerase
MIIGASSFASPLSDLQKEVESIELYVPKLRLYNRKKMIKKAVDELHDILSTCCFHTTMHAPYYGDSPTYPKELIVDIAHMGKNQFRLMEESIHLAGDFGCSVVVVHPGRITGDREECFSLMVQNLRKLVREAENCGVVIGLENKEGTDPSNLCCTAEEHRRAVEEINSPWLKATFDVGHANLTCGGDKVKLKQFINEIRDIVVHVHVHDNTGMNGEKYFGDVHGVPGEGNIDFHVLRDLHFNGVFNLEVFSLEGVRAGKTMLEGLDI